MNSSSSSSGKFRWVSMLPPKTTGWQSNWLSNCHQIVWLKGHVSHSHTMILLSSTAKVQLHVHKYLSPAGPKGIKHKSESPSLVVSPPLCPVPLHRLELCPHRGLRTCHPVVTNVFRKGRYFPFSLSPTMFTCVKTDPLLSLPQKES